VTVTDAAARIRDTFAVEPVTEGALLTAVVPVERWQEAGRLARDELGCRYFNWLSAVDWKTEGFEVLCRVDNLQAGFGLMLKARLGPGVDRCATLTGLYRGADWMERECYDMFGIRFDGHPDLRRILLGDDWEGHPLRKDYAVDTPHLPYR
jgi:NADH-quinone oxidoreductase subunit C